MKLYDHPLSPYAMKIRMILAEKGIEHEKHEIHTHAQRDELLALNPRAEVPALVDGETRAEIVVTDNGRGLPAQARERLTEPYVTTREKGTGLGLAIVKKIMEDHRGEVLLEDAPEGGARVRLCFPKDGHSIEEGEAPGRTSSTRRAEGIGEVELRTDAG